MELSVDFADEVSVLAGFFSGLLWLRLGCFGGVAECLQELFFFDDTDEAIYDLSFFYEEKCGERLNGKRVFYFVYVGFVNADGGDFNVAVVFGDADECRDHHEAWRTAG